MLRVLKDFSGMMAETNLDFDYMYDCTYFVQINDDDCLEFQNNKN